MSKNNEEKQLMSKKKAGLAKGVKSFWTDFKKFITRGNVLDMAVGVIVGSAFTAIVNALSNNILKPLINWLIAVIVGADSLENIHTVLFPVYLEDNTIDWANTIFIDWGAFINAIINFLLIALTLFTIVRVLTNIQKKMEERANAEKIAAAKAEEERKKAEAEAQAQAAAQAAAAQAEAEAKAKAEQQAALEQFYRNVQRQTELLEQLANK